MLDAPQERLVKRHKKTYKSRHYEAAQRIKKSSSRRSTTIHTTQLTDPTPQLGWSPQHTLAPDLDEEQTRTMSRPNLKSARRPDLFQQQLISIIPCPGIQMVLNRAPPPLGSAPVSHLALVEIQCMILLIILSAI